MLQKVMSPSGLSLFAAILRQSLSDRFVWAKGSPEVLGFGPDTGNKDPGQRDPGGPSGPPTSVFTVSQAVFKEVTGLVESTGPGGRPCPRTSRRRAWASAHLRTIDDTDNLGLRKRLIGEVDVFQLDPTHELYNT
jgi:hypothetical protein